MTSISVVIKKIHNKEYMYFWQWKDDKKVEKYVGRKDDPSVAKKAIDLFLDHQDYELNLFLEKLSEQGYSVPNPQEARRRLYEGLQERIKKLEHGEMEALVRLALSENGLSAYDLEILGVPDIKIRQLVTKLSDLNLIEKKSTSITKAGRKIAVYGISSIGAMAAFEYLQKKGELNEDLKKKATGRFDLTPLGALLKAKIEKVEGESRH